MRALGVDRVEGGFVLALLDVTGRTPEVRDTQVVSCSSTDRPAERLLSAIEQMSPTPPDAVGSALDERQVTHRLLHLPFSDPARLNSTVPFELESLVPFDLDEAITTFTVLSKNAGSELLAALVSRKALAAHLEELAEAGVDPAIVDIGAVALCGLVGLGCSNALLVEPRAGGAVALLRDQHLRGLHILSSEGPEAIGREARWLALTLLDEEDPPRVVELAAPNAGIDAAGLLEAPSLELDKALPDWAAGVDPGCLRAVALAGRAAGLISTGVNFRTGEFTYHAPSEEAQRQLRRTAMIAAATVALGLVSYGVVVAERNTELDALRDEIRQTVSPIVSAAPPGQERIRLEGAVEGLERRRAMLAGSTSARPPVLDVFRLITEAVPTSTAFEIQELSVDGEGLRFRAQTDTYESVDVIKRALAGLPHAAEPDVRDVKKGIDDRIEFRVGIDFPAGARP